MAKWEYLTVIATVPDPDKQREVLNAKGILGWELVAVGSYRNQPLYYFKKKRE